MVAIPECPNTRRYELTDKERVVVFAALAHFCNATSHFDLLKKFEEPIPETPAWRLLSDDVQNTLAGLMIEEVEDSSKEYAHEVLDECGLQELTEMYGFDEDLVKQLCYNDPKDIIMGTPSTNEGDLAALVNMDMFRVSPSGEWLPTKMTQRWLEEFIGYSIDFDKAKEFVA